MCVFKSFRVGRQWNESVRGHTEEHTSHWAAVPGSARSHRVLHWRQHDRESDCVCYWWVFIYSRKHHPHSYSLAKALISCAKVTTPKTPWEFLTHCSKHQWEFSSNKSTLTTGVITVAALFSVNISRYFFAFSLFCIVMSCLQYTNKLLVIWYRNCVNCIELVVKHIWKV